MYTKNLLKFHKYSYIGRKWVRIEWTWQSGRHMRKVFPAAVPVSEMLEVLNFLGQGFKNFWLFSEVTAAGKTFRIWLVLDGDKFILFFRGVGFNSC